MPAKPILPIESVVPALREALQTHPSVVLQAPPGAGKTTRVPLALLDEDWLGGQKIVMLEPRRLAARAAAHRMASTLGERVGATVGYRVRLDTRVGPTTRIEVVTEGVLTRMLQSNPALDGVGLVIFDEFHERNLPSDLGLAFALETQEALRDDLRLLVMSATLDGARVAALLDEAPLLTSEGRAYPVETHTLDRMPEPHWKIGGHIASAVHRALAEHEGDVLVFLPGAGEIKRAETMLRESGLPADVAVTPLYGNLPHEAQDRAIAPSPPGRRKVVLATPIAETSLTIEGVRVVIDSGLARAPRFDPNSGLSRLETVRISKASADQRRGRAGRLGPGVCYRLWTPPVQAHLAEHTPPEVLTTDLAPLALELAAWGVHDPATLRWLDPPPEATFAASRDLLTDLGALDGGIVTAHGRAMATLGLHPRLAHLVLTGRDLGAGATACDLAALLSERDLFKTQGSHPPPADLRLRLDLLAGEDRAASGFSQGYAVARGSVHRVRQEAKHWRKRLGIPASDRDADAAGTLLALAYPDRIAQRRPDSETRYRLRNGRAAVLTESQALAGADFLVAAHLDGRRGEARIFLAAPLSQDEIEQHFAEQVVAQDAVAWDPDARRVQARRQERLGAVVLREAPLRNPDPAAVTAVLLDGVRAGGLDLLPWSKDAQRLRERLGFLHRLDAAWPDVSDEALLATLDTWLGPHLTGGRTGLGHLDLSQILLGLAGWNRGDLDRLAPTHLTVPSGSNIPIDYSDPNAPVLAVRLQEVFGLTETPRIGGSRVPLTMHLLSPAHRPVQVTQDLASFWREAYFDVRKDLRGRYPKHPWPEDPLTAPPTNRTKRRR